ncbi:MAG: hypothetical protein R6V85_16205 [Polyangia bacterium]
MVDSSVLSPFARSERLVDLERITAGWNRLATRDVLAEIERGIQEHPALEDALSLPWLTEVRNDGVAELGAFAMYSRRLVDDKGRNVGEASVLAHAEVHGCDALVDDETAVRLGRERGVEVRRSLAMIAAKVARGEVPEQEAERLVDDLIGGGARYPFAAGEEFIRWCTRNGLL